MVEDFTFLGIIYNLKKETIFIQEEKLSVIDSFCSPRSRAELFSRMSSFNYYRNYITRLKIVAAPLYFLLKQEEFI